MSRFNLIWPKYQDVTARVYDATKFSAEVMMGMMRTHPLVIDSVARPNPFYVPPEELLKETLMWLQARQTHNFVVSCALPSSRMCVDKYNMARN